MNGTLHVWEDGKGMLILDGDVTAETVALIDQAFHDANREARLLVFPFPVEVIHESGRLEWAGVAKYPTAEERHGTGPT